MSIAYGYVLFGAIGVGGGGGGLGNGAGVVVIIASDGGGLGIDGQCIGGSDGSEGTGGGVGSGGSEGSFGSGNGFSFLHPLTPLISTETCNISATFCFPWIFEGFSK